MDQSTLAIILCDNLKPNVYSCDLTEDNEDSASLSPRYRDISRQHSEVLLYANPHATTPVQPLVNPHAVWSLPYHELVQIYLGSPYPPFPEDMAQERQEDVLSLLKAQFFYQCTYCQGYGHDESGCWKFRDWLFEEAAIARYYKLE